MFQNQDGVDVILAGGQKQENVMELDSVGDVRR